MAADLQARVADALFERAYLLHTWPAMQHAFPGISFSPEAGKPHLEIAFLPAQTERAQSEKSVNRYIGLLQVTVVWPQGGGDIKPLEAADLVCQHFQRGTRLRADGLTVLVDVPPYVSPAVSDPPWRRWPVSIRYRAFPDGEQA